MTAGATGGGPIDAAIAAISTGMEEADAATLAKLVRTGLERLDTTAPDESIAREEIAPAAELPVGERLDWAREFALNPLVSRLNGQAWRLARELVEGGRAAGEVSEEAGALLAELEAVDLSELSGERHHRLLRKRNEAIADVRWVMAGGQGPASLRIGRLKNRR